MQIIADYLKYKQVNDHEVIVVGSSPTDWFEIPNIVTREDGKQFTMIGNSISMFRDAEACFDLVVMLPSSFKIFIYFPFQSVKVSIESPNNFIAIKKGAICHNCPYEVTKYNQNRSFVNLRETIKIVVRCAFMGLKKLEIVVIPPSVESINDLAFIWTNLKRIIIKPNSRLIKIGSKAFAKSKITNISFPKYIEEIMAKAFFSCKKLEEISFHECLNLKKIGSCCFENTLIKEVTFPASLEEICEKAFSWCVCLQKISFHKNSNLKIIKNCAFESTAIEMVEIPEKTEKIEAYAFYDLLELKTLIFKDRAELKEIGIYAFARSSIEKVQFPSSIEIIDDFALCGCKKLKSVSFADDSTLKSVRSNIFAETLFENLID